MILRPSLAALALVVATASGAPTLAAAAQRAPRAGTPPPNCFSRSYSDPTGDGVVDIVAYALSYDCRTGEWRLAATLGAPLDPSVFGDFAVEIETDGNLTNGCGGFDYVVGGTLLGSSHRAVGQVWRTPSCDTNGFVPTGTAAFSPVNASMSLFFSASSIGNPSHLTWNGDAANTTGDSVDLIPDIGSQVASGFVPPADSYWLADSSGHVHRFGTAASFGDLSGHSLTAPIVGMARRPDLSGYWLLGRDGGISSFGAAAFFGSTGNLRLNRPVVAMASTPSGHGYWFVASDGGIFSFGDARFFGSTGAIRLNRPIVGMAPTPTGRGYWFVASDGGIFSFGDAHFYGSTGSAHLTRPIVGMAASATGHGYRFVAADGGIFTFGDAPFWGSLAGSGSSRTIVALG